MSNVQLGQKITSAAERDAVHVALIPLVIGKEDYLHQGSLFRIKYGTHNVALRGHTREDSLGVIDPFLDEYLSEGDRCWGVLFPNMVTGMRHHWFHPAFDNVGVPKNIHESWLRDFACRWNFDWDELMAAATDTDEDWRYVVARGTDLHSKGELGEDHSLFWHHLEAFLDRTFTDEEKDGMGWSCTC